MPSVCSGQYPRCVFRGGERLLWNPVTRTALRNRPEERVRLRLVEHLTASGWPRTRISTEEGHRSYTEERLRTDILCYGEDYRPALLVECKAGSVSLGEPAARQAARYNEEVGARWLLLSNGREDHWYETRGGTSGSGTPTPRRLEGPPPLPELSGGSPPPRDFEWWRQRGFLGNETPKELGGPLAGLLDAFWSPPGCPVRYLDFSGGPAPFPIDQYYLFRETASHRIALAPVPAPGGDTRLAGVLNRNGENVALALFAPTLSGDNRDHTVRLFDREGEHEAEAGERLRLEEENERGDLPARWARELEELFEGG